MPLIESFRGRIDAIFNIEEHIYDEDLILDSIHKYVSETTLGNNFIMFQFRIFNAIALIVFIAVKVVIYTKIHLFIKQSNKNYLYDNDRTRMRKKRNKKVN